MQKLGRRSESFTPRSGKYCICAMQDMIVKIGGYLVIALVVPATAGVSRTWSFTGSVQHSLLSSSSLLGQNISLPTLPHCFLMFYPQEQHFQSA